MLDELSVRLDRPAKLGGVGELLGNAPSATQQPETTSELSHSEAPHSRKSSSFKSLTSLFTMLVAAGVLFGAGWFVHGFIATNSEKEVLPPESLIASAQNESVVPVTVEPITLRPVQRTIEGVGTLYGYEEIDVSARVGGLVQRIHFEVGDRLHPGEHLVEIEPTDYELGVEQADRALLVELAKLGLTEPPDADIDLSALPTVMLAQTRLDNSKRRAERAQALMDSRSISPEDYDNVSSDYRAMRLEYANQLLLAKAYLATVRMRQADLAIARKKLSDTRIQVTPLTRPVPGMDTGVSYVVTERNVSEGGMVAPGSVLCKLVVDRTLKLSVSIPERYSTEVQLGQKVEVQTSAYPHPFEGTVTRVNPAVDTATRTFDVEIQVPNSNGQLKPGSFAKAAILTRVEPNAVTVPLSALVSFAGINKIFLIDEGHAKEVHVVLGQQTSDWVEIASPSLSSESFAITSGHSLVADQTPVRIREGVGEPQ